MMSGGRQIRTRVGLPNVRGEGAPNVIGSVGEVEIIVSRSVVTKNGIIDEGSQIDGSSLSIKFINLPLVRRMRWVKILTLFHLPIILAPNKSAPSC